MEVCLEDTVTGTPFLEYFFITFQILIHKTHSWSYTLHCVQCLCAHQNKIVGAMLHLYAAVEGKSKLFLNTENLDPQNNFVTEF